MKDNDFQFKNFQTRDNAAKRKILQMDCMDAIDAIDSFSEELADKIAGFAVSVSEDYTEQNNYLNKIFVGAGYSGSLIEVVRQKVNELRCQTN